MIHILVVILVRIDGTEDIVRAKLAKCEECKVIGSNRQILDNGLSV